MATDPEHLQVLILQLLCLLHYWYNALLWYLLCRGFVTTELVSIPRGGRMNYRHGHRVCWMSTCRKNGLMSRTHVHKPFLRPKFSPPGIICRVGKRASIPYERAPSVQQHTCVGVEQRGLTGGASKTYPGILVKSCSICSLRVRRSAGMFIAGEVFYCGRTDPEMPPPLSYC